MEHRDATLVGLGVVLALTGLVLLVAHLRWQLRNGMWGLEYRPPGWDVSRERRRALRAQIIALRPPADADLPELHAVARVMVDAGKGLLLPAGLGMMQVGFALTDQARWHLVFALVFTLTLGAVMVFTARRAHQAARFLDRFPEQGTHHQSQ